MPQPRLLVLSFAALIAACATGRRAAVTTPSAEAVASAERRASGRAISRYVSARLAEAGGDPARAAGELRLALVHDPESPQLRIAYAEALARAGRLEDAEAEARRAIDLAQDGTAAATDAHLALGKALALSGRTSAALDELAAAARIEGALAHSPHREGEDGDEEPSFDPEPWRALARVRVESGDADGAAAACEELAALDRAEGAAGFRELAAKLLDAKKVDAARERLRRAVDLAPAEPESWKLLAQVEESQERLGEARQAWDKALAADPDDAEALLGAGRLALRDGDLEKARSCLGAVVAASSDEVGARIRVAAAWLDARRPAEALAAVSVGADARLVYLKGVALEQLRRWREAAEAFEAVEPASGELYASARASLSYALLRAGRPAEAVRAARRGLQERPSDPSLLFALGQAYDRAGQRDAALAQMRSVLEVKPEHAEALNYLGYSYAERGERLEEAQALLERAVALDPENGYYLDSLGWVYFKRGDVERAVKTLERADALAGPEPTILDHLGDTYRASRRPVDAAAAYRRALDAAKSPEADGEFTSASRASVERKLRDLRRHETRPASAHARDAQPARSLRN